MPTLSSRSALWLAAAVAALALALKALPQDMETLISSATSSPAKRAELLTALMKSKVVIIATWKSPQSTQITIQDFKSDGRSFIPVFSSAQHFEEEAKGSGFEEKGVEIDTNLFASMLQGTELLILNPGSKTPLELRASELRVLVDPTRLPR